MCGRRNTSIGLLLSLLFSAPNTVPSNRVQTALGTLTQDLRGGVNDPGSPGAAPANRSDSARIVSSKTQIYFEHNEGQVSSRVLYLSRAFGYSLFLTSNAATVVLPRSVDLRSGSPSASVFRLRFVGANPQADVTGIEELPGKSSYFSGPDRKSWHASIPHYAKVKYSGIYPGIDLIFYESGGELEYDFVAAPGANLQAIHVRIEGVSAKLTPEGDIALLAGKDAFRLKKPHVYQEQQEGGHIIEANYSLRGRDLKFSLGRYNHHRSIVIDPALVFSTYLESNCQPPQNPEFLPQTCTDTVADIAADQTGVYITGSTTANTFPATTSGPQQINQEFAQTYILKLNPSGTAIIYVAYLSSSAALSLAVDSVGSAYVAGTAQVQNSGVPAFPLTQGVFSGIVPAGSSPATVPYAAKLSPDGLTLTYSTLLQQPAAFSTAQTVTPARVAVDSSGALYITGQAVSQNSNLSSWAPLAVTPGAFQTTPGNLFALKLTPNASGLSYSTYIDGTQGAGFKATGIAVDSSGDAFLTGTATAGFPTTPGVFQPSDLSTLANTDSAFLMELNPSGSSQIYSTYFGGTGATSSYGLAIDPQGEAVIVGQSFDDSVPVTSNAFCGLPSIPPSFFAGYIAKFSPGGTALVYYTTLCGNDAEADAVALDSTGAAYVTGETGDPATFQAILSQPIQAYFTNTNGPPNNQVALKLDTSGNLQWSTFLGVNNASSLSRIALDPSGAVYILCGSDASGGLPGTSGTVGLNHQGMTTTDGRDFLLKIAPSLGAPVPLAMPTAVTFPALNIGTPSATSDVQVGNFGDAPTSPTVSITGDFSETDNCNGSIVPGGQKCDVEVLFTPKAAGTRTGALTLNFGGNIPSQIVALSGTGAAPAVSLSATSLSFGVQANGTTSGAQQLALTNTGTGPLIISSVQTTSEFAATSTCGGSIAPAGGCTIQVTFTPSVSGVQTGTLTITDNAPGGPQTVSLAGNEPASFSITSGTGSSMSASVQAGHTATYNLGISGANGFSSPVNLTCSGAPSGSTCSVAPDPANIAGNSAVAVTVSISTQAPAGMTLETHWPKIPRQPQFPLFTTIILGFVIACLLIARASPLWKVVPRVLAIVLLLGMFVSCGRGSSSTPSSGIGGAGTPPGQYSITITGTSGSLTQTVRLGLTVN
jgi:hypothetical protein